MELELPRKDIYDKKFINYLLWYISEAGKELVNYSKFRKLNKYFKDILKLEEDAREIFDISLKTLEVKYYLNRIVIKINTDNKVDNKFKLEHLCRLINYGNLEIDGYRIYSEIFNYIEYYINKIYGSYLQETLK